MNYYCAFYTDKYNKKIIKKVADSNKIQAKIASEKSKNNKKWP